MPAGGSTCGAWLWDGFRRRGLDVRVLGSIRAQLLFARNLGHSAAIYTAQGVLYDVRVAEKLPRRLHGVPSPVGAATGTEAARPQNNARRRAGTRGSNEKQC